MRNYTEIRFSDTTGNGKFSGKPDLPVEIFFLDAHTVPVGILGLGVTARSLQAVNEI